MSILPQLILNSIIAGAIYTLVALGFNLIYSTTKFFNLAHGTMAVIGGYVVFWLTRLHDFPLWVSIPLAVIGAGLAGVLSDRLVYTRLRTRKASGMVLLVASLGIFTAIQAVIAIIFTSQFQTLTTGQSISTVYDVFGGAITETQVVILVTGLVIMGLIGCMLKFTKLGMAIKAVGDDEEVAKIVGINTERVIGVVFFIGSAIAGVAGLLVGFDTGLEPTMGLALLLKGIVAAIVGGVGSLYGGVLGAFLLGFVENFGIWHLSGEWKDAIAFVLLIIFLIFRPQGIMRK